MIVATGFRLATTVAADLVVSTIAVSFAGSGTTDLIAAGD